MPFSMCCIAIAALTTFLPSLSLCRAHDFDYDVIVVGGGAAGTYTAVRLTDHGKRVALIEREDHLGGQVNTYIDPNTGAPFDYGVLIYENVSVTRTFFDSVGMQYKRTQPFLPNETNAVVDLAYKRPVSAQEAASISGNLTHETEIYVEQLNKYPFLSEAGFHLPDGIPDELLMPFGDWLKKYNITGLGSSLFNFDYGGNILAQPAVYMLRYHNLITVESGLPDGPGYLKAAEGGNQGLYDAAYNKLGGSSDVFLDASILSIHRDESGVRVHLSSPSQRKPRTLRASQLVMAIPPALNQVETFLDLTREEQHLFKQFNYSYVWDAIVLDPSIPTNTGISILTPEAPFGVPALPSTYGFLASGFPNVHSITYGSTNFMSNAEVKSRMLEDVTTVRSTLGYSSNGAEAKLVGFYNHSRFFFTVLTEAIRDRFYDRVAEQQGKQRTWWTGQAFQVPVSSLIWNFTEHEIIPGVLKALDC